MAQLKGYVDADEIKKAISILQKDGAVFEVRTVNTAGRKQILSGYFKDAEAVLKAFDKINFREKNIYITLGEVKDYCLARSQSGRFLENPQTTSDQDIERYRWLFVDFDPERPAGISATDAEVNNARLLSEIVAEDLERDSWPAPVTAFSGNGYHLFYRIDILNDESGRALVERVLKALSMLYSDDNVKIDTTNCNPSRICKLHGTLAQKGANVPDRPHRMSRIINIPDRIEPVPLDLLWKLARRVPDPPKQEPRRVSAPVRNEFDIIDFMSRHGITYKNMGGNDRASEVYALDHCPFNPDHRNGDAKIFQYSDGRIAFKCHHNSCKGYKWEDVRLKYEPDAYEWKDDSARFDAGWFEHITKRAAQQAAEIVQSEAKKEKRELRKLKTAADLLKKNIPDPVVFIGTDSEEPLLVEGTCILSAKPKLGKSWFCLAICMAVAKGEDFLGYKTRKCSTLYLDLETTENLQQKRLKTALAEESVSEKFYLDTETDMLGHGFIEQIESYLEQDPEIGIVVIDVFQIIRSKSKSVKETEYEHAYRDIAPLNALAQKHHIAIILVCHDRKGVNPDDPFENILGSTGLLGAATQMIVMFQRKKSDPIHISIKGKTIDGQPELNVKMDKGKWSVVEGVNSADREKEEQNREYMESDIRRAVISIVQKEGEWRGRCSELISHAIDEYDIPIVDTAKYVGGFLHRQSGRFMKNDGIKVKIVKNGTGPSIYIFSNLPLMTIDEDDGTTIDEWQDASKYAGSEIPFS